MDADLNRDIQRERTPENFEQVRYVTDPKSGLRAYIAIHSTKHGPACGGCRLWTYVSAQAARADAMNLARGMSYKNALAELPLGGGKAVILKPKGQFDRAQLFKAFGRCVDTLGGAYVTAEDVGVTPKDMADIHTETAHVAGLLKGKNASGDPSPVTAEGVFRALRLAVAHRLGRTDLKGVRIAVQGLGHVGWRLAERLHAAEASLIVTDMDQALIARAVHRFGAQACEPDQIYDIPQDVFAPCALGGAVSKVVFPRLGAKVICGAANNQLASEGLGRMLLLKGILYVPDYAANAGGIINIAGEVTGRYDKTWVAQKLDGLEATVGSIIALSERHWRPTSQVADELARARLV